MAETKPRSAQSIRDIVLSMLVVGLFVAFLYIIVLRPSPDPVRTVDAAGAASVAQTARVFDVQVPKLPDGWRATSARYTPGPTEDTGQWFNGYVDPQGQYVAVVQQDFAVDEFVVEQTQEGTADGAVEVAGRTWQRYTSPAKGDKSLVLVDPAVTTIVTGTVGYEELATFAASLHSA